DRTVTGVQTCALPIWPRDRHDRGHVARRQAEFAAAEIPRAGRAPMRYLYLGHADRRRGAAEEEPRSERGGGAFRPRRQSLPLYQIGRASCRERAERGG